MLLWKLDIIPSPFLDEPYSEFEGEFSLYFEGTRDQLHQKIKDLVLAGARVLSSSEIEKENWTSKCDELMDPICAGEFKVVPLNAPDFTRSPITRSEINIVVGTGFGTGHHATTRGILELVSKMPPEIFQEKHGLDIGAGSGVLSIALAKRFGSRMDALEYDALALSNCLENLQMNNQGHLVTPILGSFPSTPFNGKYDFILANIYADLLEKNASVIYTLLKPESYCWISGFMENQKNRVIQAFLDTKLVVVDIIQIDEWIIAQLKKK